MVHNFAKFYTPADIFLDVLRPQFLDRYQDQAILTDSFERDERYKFLKLSLFYNRESVNTRNTLIGGWSKLIKSKHYGGLFTKRGATWKVTFNCDEFIEGKIACTIKNINQ